MSAGRQTMQGTDHFPREVYRYIGARLRQVRVERGLTQAQVATVIGVSPQQYQKYEDSSSKCSLVHIYALAEHYAVSVDEILPLSHNALPPAAQERDHRADPEDDLATDTDLLARMVSGFVAITDRRLKQSIVTIVEAARKPADRG